MARVLVLGGTGHIGSAIALHLRAQGNEVSASGRGSGPRPNLDGNAITRVIGDDNHLKNLQAWTAQADIVVDAATPYPVWIHGTGSTAMIDAARQRVRTLIDTVWSRDAALIHISSFTTLRATNGVKDQIRVSMVRGMHPYFELKEVVEAEVFRAFSTGLRGCIVNPATCLGPYDLKPEQQAFIPMLLKGKVSGTVRHPINVIDVRDVAAGIGQLIKLDYPYRQIPLFGYNVGVDDLTRRICAIGGVSPPVLRAPMFLGVVGLYWMETAAAMTGRKTPWPSLPMLLVAASYEMPCSKEQTALGIQPRPLEETLKDAISWYRHIGHC